MYLAEILHANSFESPEQLSINFESRFTLTKVLKLRLDVKKSAVQSIQLQKTAITSQALIVPC